MVRQVKAGVLEVAYEDSGAAHATPVILLHGFPYDIHAYEAVTPLLLAKGCRVLTPYLRGFGPTHFLSEATPRSGQQAALAHDLIAFMDALQIEQAVLAGYDWGGRAACIVAALWPQRVRALISGCGYNIQDIAGSIEPQRPEAEFNLWYQFYFHSERGRSGLQRYRREFCQLLWRLWSPSWDFDDATFARTAGSFDNPDFVDVVIQSYRHRYGLAPGDADVQTTEDLLAGLPQISVPSVSLHGADDGVLAVKSSEGHHRFFTGPYQRRVVDRAGHNLPQEAPHEFASTILSMV